MTDILRFGVPMNELLIMSIAMITSLVYGIQKPSQVSGKVPWYHAPLILFTASIALSIGFFFASTKPASGCVQIIAGAIAVSVLYPLATNVVQIQQPSQRDGGIYRTVHITLTAIACILVLLNIGAIIGIFDIRLGYYICIYTLPLAVSLVLFSSTILVL